MTPLFRASDLLAAQTTEYLRDRLEVLGLWIQAARERDDLAAARVLTRERRLVRAELKRREGDANVE